MATVTCIKNNIANTRDRPFAVLPEMTCEAGCQTPLVGATTQQVSRQCLISGRQPCESCVSDSSFPGASRTDQSRAIAASSLRQPRQTSPVDAESALAALELAAYESQLFEVLGESPQLLECSSNPYAVLSSDINEDRCTLAERLGGKAKTLVRWFAGFGLRQTGDLPDLIECGGLRSAVRSCFSDVDLLWELSFKTVQKIEKSCCEHCLPRFEEKLEMWEAARVRPVSVDQCHLSKFRQRLLANVPKGWDNARRTFIPNGNATRRYKRKDGGNWNLEEFSDECRTELVFSSGKPRVVTLYSSENTRTLAPLHYSLYDSLKKGSWLLVGEPTRKHVEHLNGAAMLSFDYSSATDNIKTAYVREAISVLKERADHLSVEESRCLDVLGNLRIGDAVAESGQPMGSVMSFPLLCLINKTVVDLALTALLERKEISFKEWSGHRLLVNGDDLLTREVRTDTRLREQIALEGSEIGLVVNEEKTLCSPTHAEINSTLFVNGEKCRKFNASSIWMDAGTEDVLKFASEATFDGKTFRRVVRSNAHILAKQQDKHLDELPYSLQGLCRKDKKIRRALTSLPETARTIEKGVISMAPRPENYSLSRDEEQEAMRCEVERVRERGIARSSARKPRFNTRAIPDSQSLSSVLKKKRDGGQDLIPACYVRAHALKVKDALVEEGLATHLPDCLPPGDGPRVNVLIDNLRAFKMSKTQISTPGTFDASADYVRLV